MTSGRIFTHTSLFLVTFLLLLCFSLFPKSSIAQPMLGPAWTETAPNIDGILSSGEWDDADTESFSLGTHASTIYVMNDAVNLYIALVIEDDDTMLDEVAIYFDNDNSGGARVLGDDSLHWWNSFHDTYHEPPAASNDDADDGGASDGSGARTQVGLTWYYEFSHPLNSNDNEHDFSLTGGSSVGFGIMWTDKEPTPPYIYLYWPSDDPDNYGDIDIASNPNPQQPRYNSVGGILTSTNQLTILAPYLIIVGLIATVTTVAILMRRQKDEK